MTHNVVIIGSGGREHALAWKISQSKILNKLYALPGNPGISNVAELENINPSDFAKVEEFIRAKDIDVMVVGPENPLVEGISDYFAEKMPQLLVIGPKSKGAQLEGSKQFAKEFMERHSIPTARFKSFTSEKDYDAACQFLKELKPPYVLKADGLAAGKGVLILDSLAEAEAELKEMFAGKFGSASFTVVIEEYLSGIELSVFVLTDGKDYLILPEAKDYKRIGEGDTGLNTGGMGAVSPVPFATEEFMKKVEERVIIPTINGLKSDNIDYKGFIFIGLMNCNSDPYVIEYNVRMGDPETEAVMTRIESDLLQHLVSAAKGELASEKIEISEDQALTVIAVSGGYPESYDKGFEIKGLESLTNSTLFHSGTKEIDGKICTSGGRVLAITAKGNDIFEAKKRCFEEVSKISFDKMYYRRDIGDDLISLSK